MLEVHFKQLLMQVNGRVDPILQLQFDDLSS